ncbi:flagellar associated protein [Nocardiopsis sp. CA-288880]|uniref:flagellar associated protein n=1 Tax=Nocardiopsis sp. CA-288880 TaxID=3239995 RepID=UPI003D9632AE
MPRTSRTARAMRVASAACSMSPSLLGLPLLVGAFLTTLWLFGASPVHADALGGALDGTGALARTGAGAITGTGAALGGTGSDALGNAGALGLDRPGSLDQVVPERVAEPVSRTLGTVHQGLGRQDGDGAAGLLDDPGWPVDELREGARRVVGDLDRTRRDTAQNLLSPAVDAVSGVRDAPAPDGVRAREGEPESADRARGRNGRHDAPSASAGAPGGHGTVYAYAPSAAPAAEAPSAEADAEPGDTGASAATAPSAQLATGSAAPAGGAAPAVAGYLTAPPVTAPAASAVLLASRSLHPVPSGPSDDPTVSPD